MPPPLLSGDRPPAPAVATTANIEPGSAESPDPSDDAAAPRCRCPLPAGLGRHPAARWLVADNSPPAPDEFSLEPPIAVECPRRHCCLAGLAPPPGTTRLPLSAKFSDNTKPPVRGTHWRPPRAQPAGRAGRAPACAVGCSDRSSLREPHHRYVASACGSPCNPSTVYVCPPRRGY